MIIFTDLGQFSTAFAIVGVVLVIIGFYLKASNTKQSTGRAVGSMLIITIGAILLILAGSKYVAQVFEDWGFFSDRMQ